MIWEDHLDLTYPSMASTEMTVSESLDCKHEELNSDPSTRRKNLVQTGEVAQQRKVSATKPDDLSSIPGNDTVEGKNQVL